MLPHETLYGSRPASHAGPTCVGLPGRWSRRPCGAVLGPSGETRTYAVSENRHQIDVRGLWKVFGPSPRLALGDEHRAKSRSDIQQELGLVVALRDVSFHVNDGEIFVVMGLSGSGKSTLVRCLTRLIEATEGSVIIDDEDVLTYSSAELIEFRRKKVAMVFQHFGLLPHRRVLDNVAYGLEVQGMDRQSRHEKASQAIATVGLSGWEDYYPDEMSGGMQQRVGLARALAVDPEILLMDEPFSGLDPLIRREMQDELVNLQRDLHKTILFITHDLNEALKLGDRIAIMRDGQIIQEGTPEQIVTLPADDYVTEFVRDVSKAEVIGAASIMQQPNVVVYDWQGPRAALQVMRTNDADVAFLLGRDRTLKGVLTAEQAASLVRQGKENLHDAQVDAVMTAGPDTLIVNLIPLAAETEHPIAVIDERERFMGEINRGALLASMVANKQTQAQQEMEGVFFSEPADEGPRHDVEGTAVR